LPKFDTPGRAKLAIWAAENEISGSSAVGKKLGVHPSLASRWLSGDSRPEPPNRALIRTLTGIPDEDWETAEERVRRLGSLSKAQANDTAAPTGTEHK
jgi:DNA-binding transcriptional regulator YdaS (Cro superfamily)